MLYNIKYYISLFINNCSLIKTLYVNFLVFPFTIAIKLPILVYKRCDFIGLHRGCFIIDDNLTPTKFMLHIGQNKYPIYSNKGLYTQIRFQPNGKFYFGKKVIIKNGTSINIYRNASLHIGSDTLINQSSLLFCKNKITIGKHCRFGWYNQIYDTDFHYLYNEYKHEIKRIKGEIKIGNNVWITNHVTITKNSSIPSYSIIGSHSIVKGELTSDKKGALFIGNPATIKSTGYYRILNRNFELALDQWFLDNTIGNYKLEKDFNFYNYASNL